MLRLSRLLHSHERHEGSIGFMRDSLCREKEMIPDGLLDFDLLRRHYAACKIPEESKESLTTHAFVVQLMNHE